MKRILSILGTITLIATSTTSLISCDNITEYTEEKLSELKKENKISINGNTLEGIAPQEKPFNTVNNKGYFVIGRGDKNADGRIIKFKNYDLQHNKILDKHNECVLVLEFLSSRYTDLFIQENKYPNRRGYGKNDDRERFKAVYCGEGKDKPKTLIIDPKIGEVIDGTGLNNNK